jgi:lipopolysaccharide biosynthesis regulator YciM
MGKLKTYLYHVYKKEYKLAILEQTAGLRYGQIKDELSRIFRESRMICDYMEQARNTSSQEEKEIALLKALRLKPQNHKAMLEAAKFYYSTGNYAKCREMLKPIVIGPPCTHSRAAARLFADSYYREKNYRAALENYNSALDFSQYYEYKYRLSYQIANCYHYLDDRAQAKIWYREFLEGRWQKEQMTACAEYAAKYIGNSNADTFVTIPSSTTAIGQ